MRPGPRRRTVRTGAPALLLAALAGPLNAQVPLASWEGGSVELTGYVQTLSALLHPPDLVVPPEFLPLLPEDPEAFWSTDWQGIHGTVGRLQWLARFGDRVSLEVHNRLLLDVRSPGAAGGRVGLGVSVVPGRSVELSTTLVEADGLRLWHDLDRLNLRVQTSLADVTVGRQAITWGTAALFPVLDLWGRFSPFELDTQQKPGIDAVRALAYPGEGIELDLVAADRGAPEDFSAGVRATVTRGWGDFTVAGGKLWSQVMAMGAVTRVLDRTNLRAEAALPWDLDADRWQDPRVTVGVDRPGIPWSWSAEYHLNGLGSSEVEDYPEILASEALARGETYVLGRHQAGGNVLWVPDAEERLSLTLAVLVNLTDGSTAWWPSGSYDLGQSTRITAGGILSTGEALGLLLPSGGTPGMGAVPPIVPGSEYGSYGQFGFLQVAVFF